MKKLTALFLALLLSLSVALPALAADKPGDTASEMELYTLDGEKVTLTSFFGKPIVVNFWATWCPWCIYEFPEFEKMYNEYGDRIQFVMVDLCDGSYETEEKAAAFIAENECSSARTASSCRTTWAPSRTGKSSAPPWKASCRRNEPLIPIRESGLRKGGLS